MINLVSKNGFNTNILLVAEYGGGFGLHVSILSDVNLKKSNNTNQDFVRYL